MNLKLITYKNERDQLFHFSSHAFPNFWENRSELVLRENLSKLSIQNAPMDMDEGTGQQNKKALKNLVKEEIVTTSEWFKLTIDT